MIALLLLLAAQVTSGPREQLERALPPHLALVELEVPKHLAKDLELTASFRGVPRAGRSSVSLIAVDAAGKQTKSWANVKLAYRSTEWVAKSDLSEGTVVSIANSEPREVFSDKEVPALQLGLPLLREKKAGETISARDLLLPPPLPRGTQLTVIVNVGAVEVAVTGSLERPARVGEIAFARISTAHRLIRGRLADRGTLMVEGSSQ